MSDPTPSPMPRFSEKLIQWLCQEALQEEILGNLQEYHHFLHAEKKGWAFRLAFWYQVVTYLRFSTLKKISLFSNYGIMFRFNLLLTFRTFYAVGCEEIHCVFIIDSRQGLRPLNLFPFVHPVPHGLDLFDPVFGF